jgi:DNA-binding CsgD family transcriptional regulator
LGFENFRAKTVLKTVAPFLYKERQMRTNLDQIANTGVRVNALAAQSPRGNEGLGRNEWGNWVAMVNMNELRGKTARERRDAVTQLVSIISILVQSVGGAYRRSEADGERMVRMLCELSQQALAELRAWSIHENTDPADGESSAATRTQNAAALRLGMIQETVSHTVSRTLRFAECTKPFNRAARPPLVEKLTRREHDVVRLIAQGMSNKEIAASLHLTEGTVKGYISHVLAKLNVRSRTGAVLAAIDYGLV